MFIFLRKALGGIIVLLAVLFAIGLFLSTVYVPVFSDLVYWIRDYIGV